MLFEPEPAVRRSQRSLVPSFHSTVIWIEAGGAHHSVHAPALTFEFMRDYARMSGAQLIEIC